MMLTENKTSKWFATLPKELQEQVRELHHPSPYGGLVIFLFIGIWIITALIMCEFPSTAIHLLGYVIIGFVLHALGTYLHECVHGNMFRKPKLDYWLGFLAGLPIFISFTSYQVNHLLHHKYNRTRADPDEFTNLSSNPRVLSLAFYLWILIGMPIYLLLVRYVAYRHGDTKNRLRILLEDIVIVSVVSFVIILTLRLGYFDVLLNIWLIPLVLAMLMANIRAWSEHAMTRVGHPLIQSRTVTSNRFLSFFLCNINYHLEHHLFPAMPWYKLPKLHALLQAEYRRANVSVHKSFLCFIFHAFRKGIHSKI